MSVRTYQCVTIVCDGCGTEASDDGGAGRHLRAVAAVNDDLAGPCAMPVDLAWEAVGDTHRCPSCVCDRVGHNWGEARYRCWCNGHIQLVGHGPACEVSFEVCTRCGAIEEIW